MTSISDQAYLLSEQYKNAANLNARIELHRRFGTNPTDWQIWVFDHFKLPPDARVLELGCGPADLWRSNSHRLPPGWDITLSDLSPGMIEQAQANLSRRDESGPTFHFEVLDAMSIPLDDGHFDGVIANHMLYHAPDRPRALAEIQRVLKPGGRFYAATNGKDHMRELWQMIRQIVPDLDDMSGAFNRFGLENGAVQLSLWFDDIRLHRYEDGLEISEAEPLIAYVLSSRAWGNFESNDPRLQQFIELVQTSLAADGIIRISKSSGLFSACAPQDAG